MRVIVGVTGASGVIYAKRLIEELDNSAVIISDAAKKVIGHELDDFPEESFSDSDLTAAPASGSSAYDAMVVIPCSMKTLSAIANGYADNLIARSADVMLKQEKKLILVPRETPMNLIHLKNMVKAKQAGASIVPAIPAFYHKPKKIEDMVNFVVGKVLELLGVDHKLYEAWK